MKLIKLSLAAAVIASSLAAEAISVSGDMSIASNYVFRGATFTGNTPTVQGTIGVEHESGAYAGVWASGLTTGSEIDLYVGYSTEIASGISIDGGFVAYAYTQPDATSTTGDYELVMDDFGEVYVGLSADVGVDLGVTLYKGMMNLDEDSTIVEVSVDKDLGAVYVGAVYGNQLDDTAGDSYYSATVGKAFDSIKGDLSLTYANTDATDSDAVFGVVYTTSF